MKRKTMFKKAVSLVAAFALVASIFAAMPLTASAVSSVADVVLGYTDTQNVVYSGTAAKSSNTSYFNYPESSLASGHYYDDKNGFGNCKENTVTYKITENVNGTKDVYVWVANFTSSSAGSIWGVEFTVYSDGGNSIDTVYVDPSSLDATEDGQKKGVYAYIGRYTFNGDNENEKIVERLTGAEKGCLRWYAAKFTDVSDTKIVAGADNQSYIGDETSRGWEVENGVFNDETGTAADTYKTNSKDDSVSYYAKALSAGYYDVSVYVAYSSDETAPSDVTASVKYDGGEKEAAKTLDFSKAKYDGTSKNGAWLSAGRYYFNGGDCGEGLTLSLGENGGILRASAAKFAKIDNKEVFIPVRTDPYTTTPVYDDRVSYEGNAWTGSGTGIKGPYGTPVAYNNSGEATGTFTYSIKDIQKGSYEVFKYVYNHSGLKANGELSDELVNVKHSGGTAEIRVDNTLGTVKEVKSVKRGEWVSLGVYDFKGDNTETVEMSVGTPLSEGAALRATGLKLTPAEKPKYTTDTDVIRAGADSKAAVANGAWTLTNFKLDDDKTTALSTREKGAKYSFNLTGFSGNSDVWYYIPKLSGNYAKADDMLKLTVADGDNSYDKVLDTTNLSGWVKVGSYNLSGSAKLYVERLHENASSSELTVTLATAVKVVGGESREIYWDDIDEVEKNTWGSSGLKVGDKQKTSLFTQSPSAYIKYTPTALESGKYKLEIWDAVATSDTAAKRSNSISVTVSTGYGETVATYDSSQKTASGYSEIGTYDFVGTGNEYINIKNNGTSEQYCRFGSVIKLTRVGSVANEPEKEIYILNSAESYKNVNGTASTSSAFFDSSLTYGSLKLRGVAANTAATVTITPANLKSGRYELFYWVNKGRTDYATDVTAVINHSNGESDAVTVPDMNNATVEGYISLGTFNFDGSGNETIVFSKAGNTAADGKCMRIGAVKLVRTLVSADEINNVTGRDVILETNGDFVPATVTVDGAQAEFTLGSNGRVFIGGTYFTEAKNYTIVLENSKSVSCTVIQPIYDVPADIVSDTGKATVAVSGNYAVYIKSDTDVTAAIKNGANKVPSVSAKAANKDSDGYSKAGMYFLNAGNIEFTGADSFKLVYSGAQDLAVTKFATGAYNRGDNVLASSMAYFTVSAEVYNDSDMDVTAPNCYAAVFKADGTLKTFFEITADSATVTFGNSVKYNKSYSNLKLEDGDKVSVFFWKNGIMSPICSSYVNTFNQ